MPENEFRSIQWPFEFQIPSNRTRTARCTTHNARRTTHDNDDDADADAPDFRATVPPTVSSNSSLLPASNQDRRARSSTRRLVVRSGCRPLPTTTTLTTSSIPDRPAARADNMRLCPRGTSSWRSTARTSGPSTRIVLLMPATLAREVLLATMPIAITNM